MAVAREEELARCGDPRSTAAEAPAALELSRPKSLASAVENNKGGHGKRTFLIRRANIGASNVNIYMIHMRPLNVNFSFVSIWLSHMDRSDVVAAFVMTSQRC